MVIRLLVAYLAISFAMPAEGQTVFRPLSVDEAIEAAKAEKKMVFMDFYTDWCGPCKMMEREVFSRKDVGDYMNRHFIPIKLNAEKDGQPSAVRFKVKGYPTFIVIDAGGKTLMTKMGAMSANNFLSLLVSQTDPDYSPELMKTRYERGERTASLISTYAAYLLSEDRTGTGKSAQKAQSIVSDYFNHLDTPARLSHENVFIYTTYTGDIDTQIARFMVKNRQNFAKEDSNRIADKIDLLYKVKLYHYLMGDIPNHSPVYTSFKKEILELGMNRNHRYDGVFTLIECYSKDNLRAFLDRCDKVYPDLDEEQQSCLISSLGSLVDTTDDALRKKAASFIRSRLATMTINQLGLVVYPLSLLER